MEMYLLLFFRFAGDCGLKIYHLVGDKSNSYHTNRYTHSDIIKNIICDFKN